MSPYILGFRRQYEKAPHPQGYGKLGQHASKGLEEEIEEEGWADRYLFDPAYDL
jgi:hypothetical protein